MHKNWTIILLRLLFSLPVFLSLPQAKAQVPQGVISIHDSIDDVVIPLSHIMILEDNQNLPFTRIKSSEFQNAFVAGNTIESFKLNQPYWIKVALLNQTKEDKRWYLQLPLHSEDVSVYISNPDGHFQHYETGQEKIFDSRPIHLRTLVFELPMYKDQITEVYYRKIAHKHYDPSIVISAPSRYLEIHTNAYLLLGFIYGVLCLMAIYNFVLYLSIKDKIYLYYLLYTFCAAFFITWKDGLGFEFLWSHFPKINTYHHSAGLLLLLLAFMAYAVNFLELRSRQPKVRLVILCIASIDIVYFLFNITNPGFFDPLPVPYLLSYVTLFGLTAYYAVKKYQPAIYLMISIGSILTALIVIKLRYLNLIHWNWFIEYILNYAVVLDAIVMSLAIRGKLAYLREETERAMATIMQEEQLRAESKLVQERNEHLEAEIMHQNSELSMLATNLAQHNELFNTLKKELATASKESASGSALSRLIKDIEKGNEADNNWEQFRLNFDKAHNNFLTRLREKFPALKPTDLLFCAYLKLNKSNKEIATLLNMSTSAVEKRRFRLREKMGLEVNLTLSDFLLNF